MERDRWSHIRGVFFDLYGTLAGFNPSRFEIQSKAAADFDITLTEAGVLRGYAAADVRSLTAVPPIP